MLQSKNNITNTHRMLTETYGIEKQW